MALKSTRLPSIPFAASQTLQNSRQGTPISPQKPGIGFELNNDLWSMFRRVFSELFHNHSSWFGRACCRPLLFLMMRGRHEIVTKLFPSVNYIANDDYHCGVQINPRLIAFNSFLRFTLLFSTLSNGIC